MTIETATVTDAADILALQKLAYLSEAELYNDFTIPPLTQTLDEIAAEFDRRTFLKAVERGTIIGSVQGLQVGGTCHVGRLVVHPERQGEGTGTRLMAAIEAAFADVERFELFTGHQSAANIRLYERLGYRMCRTEAATPALSLVFRKERYVDDQGGNRKTAQHPEVQKRHGFGRDSSISSGCRQTGPFRVQRPAVALQDRQGR